MREWRNWQTRTFEGRVVTPYGFKSRFSHHKKEDVNDILFFVVRKQIRESVVCEAEERQRKRSFLCVERSETCSRCPVSRAQHYDILFFVVRKQIRESVVCEAEERQRKLRFETIFAPCIKILSPLDNRKLML